jgi:hypothetical protein
MPLSGCGVEINIDTRQLAGAAEKIRRSVEKVPPEPSNSSASAEPPGGTQNSPYMPDSTNEITGAKMDQEPRLALKIRLDQAKKMYAWSLYRTDISDPIKFSVAIFPTEAAATIAGMAVLTRVSEPRRPLGTRRWLALNRRRLRSPRELTKFAPNRHRKLMPLAGLEPTRFFHRLILSQVWSVRGAKLVAVWL